MNKKVIGIDLGTGRSCVAGIETGKPVVIVNSEGQRTTPSVVSFKDGERKVGDSAKRQSLVNINNTVYNVKRLMGVKYSEAKKNGILDKLTYNVHPDENDNPRITIEDRDYTPEEISAMILSKMKSTAEEFYGCEVSDAVITCPAWFDDPARQATKNAGTIAGINVLSVINEPTAAIMSSNIDVNTEAIVMVADIGQGTTDFSVCDIADGMVEIKASKGDVFLGGSDFDNAITQWIIDEIKKDCSVDVSKDQMAMQRIIESAEKAKIELSTTQQTEINLPYITAADSVPVHFVKTLSRAKMDSLCSDIVDRIIRCGIEALKAAKIDKSQLSYILLVGGQSRSVAIQDALSKEFGAELNKSVNPDEAVALGAAIQANVKVGGEGSQDAMLLLDITPLNLGIETLGGVMTSMIEANTTIPAKHTQIFSTAVDNQPSVTINVLQGCRPMAKDNKSIGIFNLDGIMPAKKGVPQIEVTFDIDSNGILSVKAVDKATGKEQNITIQSKTSISEDEIERMKAEAEKYADEDRKEKERMDKENKCEGLMYSIDDMIESLKDNENLTDDDKNFFKAKKDELSAMKENKSFDGFDDIEKAVQERMYSISAKAYKQNSGNSESTPGFINDLMKGKNPNTGFGFDSSNFASNN